MNKFLVFLVLLLGLALTLLLTTDIESYFDKPEPIAEMAAKIVIPDPTIEVLPDKKIIVEEIRKLARWETAHSKYAQDYVGVKNPDQLFGWCGEKLTLAVYVKVNAGIDFANQSEYDVEVVNHDTVWIHLPKAEVLDVVMDNKRTHVIKEKSYVGLFAVHDPDMDQEVRVRAENELEFRAVNVDDILSIANENAKEMVTSLLNKLNFTKIYFFDEPLVYIVDEPAVEEDPAESPDEGIYYSED